MLSFSFCRFRLRDTPFGIGLTSVIGVSEVKNVKWHVAKRRNGENESQTVGDLKSELLGEGDEVILEYKEI